MNKKLRKKTKIKWNTNFWYIKKNKKMCHLLKVLNKINSFHFHKINKIIKKIKKNTIKNIKKNIEYKINL